MISTKGRYALRVMIDLAENTNKGYIPLKDIAARQEISKKYLESIVKKLVNDKLIIGASGKNGGYMLSRAPKEYAILEILLSAEGTLSSVACLADPDYKCPRKKKCKTLPLWTEYNELVYSFWKNKRLSELINS
ncbi:MAG: Rrf2 family transcriptional regulator [Eubacterium sp.]|nr:Rrf2 family transcriptional regulator [Eubacterium sp.]